MRSVDTQYYPQTVLEIGSYDVNGTIRDIVAPVKRFLGVDLVPGPGVDFVSPGHLVDNRWGQFDAVFSCEVFEHDKHWKKTLTRMYELCAPGGFVAFTCASTGRPEHGTPRTNPIDSPGTSKEGEWYYQNVSYEEAAVLVSGLGFTRAKLWYNPSSFDLYFVGIKDGTTKRLDVENFMKTYRPMSSISSRAILRFPIILIATLFRKRFPGFVDSFSNCYWTPIRFLRLSLFGHSSVTPPEHP